MIPTVFPGGVWFGGAADGRDKFKRLFRVAILLVLVPLGFLTVRADTTRTQTIALTRGWNAVFLEVYPADPEPAAVFDGTAVDVVATVFSRSSSVQFVTEPGVDLFRQGGWGVWYAEDRPDAFLKTLHAIHGQQAYLIHAREDFTWSITGAVVPPRVDWCSDAYNLVGFSVSATGAPTFAQFFAGSPAHQPLWIYRLVSGTWRRVMDPTAEVMRSGEAFWVYCDGASNYQGPLRVETPTHQGLILRRQVQSLVLRNEANYPVTPFLEHVAEGADAVPLSIVIRVVASGRTPVRSVSAGKAAGHWTQTVPTLEAGGALRVPLELRVEDMTTFESRSLLRISTDLGTEVWIPVVGIREDLEEQ